MGKDWFGSLELAYKYALNAYIRDQQDPEKSKQTADRLPIGMREKDEGDLFGVRAIEAGFYGGVAQSAPVSRAGSPVASRSTSPTRAARPHGMPIPQNQFGSATTLVHNQHNPNLSRLPGEYKPSDNYMGMHDSVANSANGSVYSTGQLHHEPQLPSIRLSSPSPVNEDLIPSVHVDSVFSVLSPFIPVASDHSSVPAASPSPSVSSPHQRPSVKLQPSQAEISGRTSHSQVNMSQEISAVSPGSTHSFQLKSLYHEDPQPSTQFPPTLQDVSVDSQNLDYSHARIHSMESSLGALNPELGDWDGSDIMQASLSPMFKDGPEGRGKTSFEIDSSFANLYEQSLRGSVISRTASIGTISSLEIIKEEQRPPVPPIRLPAFQKTAIIDQSNPLFNQFKEERNHTRMTRDDSYLDNSVGRQVEERRSERSDDAASQRTGRPDHLTVKHSPRTSFSFDYANSEETHPEDKAFTVQTLRPAASPNLPPARYYGTGTYKPAGRPRTATLSTASFEAPF